MVGHPGRNTMHGLGAPHANKKALESFDSRASDSQPSPMLRLPRTLESTPAKGDEKVQ